MNQPVLGKLYISNLTSESFSIYWNGTEGEFDGFILEIIDSDWLMEPKEYNISHTVQSHDVTGLRPSTDYVAYLYGTYKGSRTSALSIVASTGILILCITKNRHFCYELLNLLICTVKFPWTCIHRDKYMLSISVNEYILYVSLPPCS